MDSETRNKLIELMKGKVRCKRDLHQCLSLHGKFSFISILIYNRNTTNIDIFV